MDELTSARNRVDRFLAAFNTIEGELRRRLQAEKHAGYKELARRFRDGNGWWRRSYEAMETIAEMRNFLVHEKVHPTIYAAVPSEDVIALIERIRDELIRPTTVMDRFARKVVEFTPETEISDALRVIVEKAITHFPVREADGTRRHGVTVSALMDANGLATDSVQPGDVLRLP
jgi:CBS domain-containing protein